MKIEYYNAKEIKEKIGCCLSKAYELIDSLNKCLKEEYPRLIVIEHKVPIWYWDIKTKPIENECLNGNGVVIDGNK